MGATLKRISFTWSWGLAAAVALLWPSRVISPLDGVPLDRAAEAVLVGVVFPALWWFHPVFLTTRVARVCIVALLCIKALGAFALVQDGWCLRFSPVTPYVLDETGAPHAWDVRADWRSPNPACSAIVTRPYDHLEDFPAWFFNLPPVRDGDRLLPTDRPPGATVPTTVTGVLYASRKGLFQIESEPVGEVWIDGGRVSPNESAREGVVLGTGLHTVSIKMTLTGDRWRFVPRWNRAILWSRVVATPEPPARIDRLVRPLVGWMTFAVASVLLAAWVLSFAVRIHDPVMLAWVISASSCAAILGAQNGSLTRYLVPALAGSALVRVPPRLRNVTGAFALIGIPWLAMIVARSAMFIGRFRLYSWGDDFWTFQRAAYRIVMQGYWLEGGSRTFWFQPLYRWIAGCLHLVFGDSSVGEWYWDGACVLATALFAFHVTKVFAGFRWGLIAAASTLTVVTFGPSWEQIGLGLSEMSSAGLLYLAAFYALRSRHGRWRAAVASGVLASLGFYTRLNNLPMALAVCLFALPISHSIRALPLAAWPRQLSGRTVAVVVGTLSLALVLFAWRTWYYTGVFSVTYGTQARHLALWQPGTPPIVLLQRMGDSLMMVATMNDPPRFDWRASTIMAGVIVSVLAIAGVPRLRDLSAPMVLFCVAGLGGALVARGSAYAGRFSIHEIAIATAVTACAGAKLLPAGIRKKSKRVQSAGNGRPDGRPLEV